MPRLYGETRRPLGIASRKRLERWNPTTRSTSTSTSTTDKDKDKDKDTNGGNAWCTFDSPLLPSTPQNHNDNDDDNNDDNNHNHDTPTPRVVHRSRRRRRRRRSCGNKQTTRKDDDNNNTTNNNNNDTNHHHNNDTTPHTWLSHDGNNGGGGATVTPASDHGSVNSQQQQQQPEEDGTMDDAGEERERTTSTSTSSTSTTFTTTPLMRLTRTSVWGATNGGSSSSPLPPPVPVSEDCASIPRDKQAGRGYLSHAQAWWQIVCPAMPHVFDISFSLLNDKNNNVWETEPGQQLQWEAHLLTWIHDDHHHHHHHDRNTDSDDDDVVVVDDDTVVLYAKDHSTTTTTTTTTAASLYFAQPLDLLVTPDGLSLRMDMDDGVSSEVTLLGSLQDLVVRLSKTRHTTTTTMETATTKKTMPCAVVGGGGGGSMVAEPVVAWWVLQILGAVRTLHKCRVTHNDLGLDSFLVVRRGKPPPPPPPPPPTQVQAQPLCDTTTNTNNTTAMNQTWGVLCTGLGYKAQRWMDGGSTTITTSTTTTSDIETEEEWRFRHDLYSVANMVTLLLSCGEVPMEVCRTSDGVVHHRHWDRLVYGNPCIRHAKKWERLFQAMLNPPSAAHGIHMLDAASLRGKESRFSAWPELTDACRDLASMAAVVDCDQASFLNGLMEELSMDTPVGPHTGGFVKWTGPVDPSSFVMSVEHSHDGLRYDALLHEKLQEQRQAFEREQTLQRDLLAAGHRFDEYHKTAEAEKLRIKAEFEAALSAAQQEHEKTRACVLQAEADSAAKWKDDLESVREKARGVEESYKRKLQQLQEDHGQEVRELEERISTETRQTASLDSDVCVLQQQVTELMDQLRQKHEEIEWWKQRENTIKHADKALGMQLGDCRKAEDPIWRTEQELVRHKRPLADEDSAADHVPGGKAIKQSPTTTSAFTSPHGPARTSPRIGGSAKRRCKFSPRGRSPRASAPVCKLIDLTLNNATASGPRRSPSSMGSTSKGSTQKKRTKRSLVIAPLSDSDASDHEYC